MRLEFPRHAAWMVGMVFAMSSLRSRSPFVARVATQIRTFSSPLSIQPMAGYRQFVFSGDQVGTVRPGGRFRLTGLPAGRQDVHLADFARAGAVVVSEWGVETGTRDLRLVVPPADD